MTRNNTVSKDADTTLVEHLTRGKIEEAMDAYDSFQKSGVHHVVFNGFARPRHFWVRSTRARANRVYPSKPIHYWAIALP